MRKKSTLLVLFLLFLVMLSAIETFDKAIYNPAINVCFSKDLIGNGEGKFEITTNNGIIETRFQGFNQIAKEYEIIELKQLYRVKNRTWNFNGIYPMNIFQVKVKDVKRIDELMQKLSSESYLVFSEFDPILKTSMTTNDPFITSQWALKNIDAFRAWDYETGSNQVVIGVVDSGVKWNHPDLKDNIWINQAEMAGATINWETGQITGDNVDNDNNGYVDDIFGWDFCQSEYEEDNNPYQAFYGNNHGTHVAGCAAAMGNNTVGVVGPAFNVKIMVSKHQPSDMPTNSIYNGYAGVYYCADNGADIINCSWGGRGGSNSAETAINYARNQGALVFAAASNDNTDNTYTHYYPSDATNAVSVAATDSMDKRASFSNYGTPIDISAPGVSILSTIFNTEGNNSYSSFSGTSMATPVACGVAALIKSMYPDLTPDQLKARIMAGCDSIDVLNPGYEGKLGAGRVNAFNSLMYDKIPNLSISNYQINEVQGDNDNVVNPGETISLSVELKNKLGWMNCEGLTGKLRSTDPRVTIIDSVFTIDSILSGQSESSTQNVTFMVSSDYPVITQLPIFIEIISNENSEYTYHTNLQVSVPMTLMQKYWPFENNLSAVYSPSLIDVNNDGEQEILFTSYNGKVQLIDKEKNNLPGFPVDLQEIIFSSPAIMTWNNETFFVVSTLHHIYKISTLGQIISTYFSEGVIRSNPTIADMNNDGNPEIILGNLDEQIIVLNSDGTTYYPGFPVTLSGNIISSVTVTDMNNDGIKDIIASTIDGFINCLNGSNGNQVSGWPYNQGQLVLNGPIVIKDENSTLVVSCGNKSLNNHLTILNQSGQTVLDMPLTTSVLGNPIASDINNDGYTEIAFADNRGKVYLMDLNGIIFNGFPVDLGVNIESSCLFVDVDGDSLQEILVSTARGKIYAISTSGSIIAGYPVDLSDQFKYSPIVGSIDQDNDLDLLISHSDKLSFIDFKTPFYTSMWSMYRLNPERNAVVYSPTTLSNHNEIESSEPIKIRIYPNPFNPITRIEWNQVTDQDVIINVYNIKGQVVKTLTHNRYSKGQHTLSWNGKNGQNKDCSAGIYFIQIRTNTNTLMKKAILLK